MKYAIQEYLLECEIRGYKPRTLDTVKSRLKDFGVYLDYPSIKNVTVSEIKGYIRYKQQTCKPLTVNAHIKCLNAFYNWCVDEQIINESPMKRIKLLPVEKTMIKAYSEKDIKLLLSYYKGSSFLQVRNKTILMMFIETGIRNSELRNIKMSDIYEDSIQVTGKRKQRSVAISIHLRKQLIKYYRARNEFIKDHDIDCLFFSTHKKQLCNLAVLNIVKKAGEYYDINVPLLIHSFRRTYAQQMLNNIDIYSLQKLLGHESIKTTEIYIQSIEDRTIIKKGMNSPLSKGFS